MKPGFFSLVLYFICINAVSAQKERNVWAFGLSAGLDFNSGAPVSIKTNILAYEGCASICDSLGQLLFYTDGSIVWDRSHNIMPNGNSLTGITNYGYGNVTPTWTTTQSSVIVRMPGNSKKYYIFSLSTGEPDLPISRMGRLCYSIVDMELNNGLGDVEVGSKSILLDSGLSEKLTAVAGTRKNAWVMVRSNIFNEYRAFEVTFSGVNSNPVVSNCGAFSAVAYGVGELKFSLNGKKMAAACFHGGLELYDFNAATGIVSNAVCLDVVDYYYKGKYYGVCFSADNSKLYAGRGFYVDTSNGIFQFDLNMPANAIAGTKTRLSDIGPCSIKLGPNGKVYINTHPYNINGLSVINFPNLAGVACQFVPDAVPLVYGRMYGGLPNEIIIPSGGTNDTVYYCANGNGIRLTSHDSNATWQVISGPGIINRFGDTVIVTTTANTRMIFFDSSGRLPDTTTIIVLDAKLDAGRDDTLIGCNGYLDTLHAALSNTIPDITYNILWQPVATIVTGGNTLHPIIAPIGNTTYKIIVTTSAAQGGCIWEDSMNIFPIDKSVDAAFTYTMRHSCNGDTVAFNNSSTGSSTLKYKWDFGNGIIDTTTNARHVYKIGDQHIVKLYVYSEACIDSFIDVVSIAPFLDAAFTVNKDTICQHDTAIFTNWSTGIGIVSNWSFDNEFNDVATDLVYVYNTPGLHEVTLTVSDHRGCHDTASRFIQVDARSHSSFVVSDSLCVGESVIFTGSFGEVGYISNKWHLGDGHMSLNKNVVHHAYTTTGTYYPILITRYRACPETQANDTVHVLSYPSVNLGPDTSLCIGGVGAILANNIEHPENYFKLWSTGATTSKISVSIPGTYWLMVANDQGCVTTDTIDIRNGCYVAIPNVFTPNGDGVNDYFFPRQLLSMNITAFTMQVYNRWGQLIFETNNLGGRGWDGTFNGSPQPESVYMYLVDVTFSNGVTEKHKGNVTLLK